jgi:putative intracellular protease/amidase
MKSYNKILLLILILGLVAVVNISAISATSHNSTSSISTSKSTTISNVQNSSKAVTSYYVTNSQVITSAINTKNYIEKNKKIPSQVKVGSRYVNSSQLLYLMTTASLQISYGKNNSIPISSFTNPSSINEKLTTGTISKNSYIDFAKRIKSFMDTNRQGPSYGVIGLGNVGYNSLIYLYSRVLYQYQTHKAIPLYMNLSSWKSTNIPTYDNPFPKFTPQYVANSATKVKNFYETNKKLPNYVIMSGVHVYMAQFLHLETTATLKLNKKDNSVITLYDDSLPSSSADELKSGSISKVSYLDFAQRIKSYIDQNHRAPSYGVTGLGKMRYQTIIYTFSKILNSYNNSKVLPASVSINAQKIIKVLLYNGAYAGPDCVSKTISTLNYANSNNLVPGFQFQCTTTTIVSSQKLSTFDLLIMPGGDGGRYYLESSNISGSAIRNFISNGGGYLGVCAGAYAACQHVDGWYDGWGIAPHIRCKEVNYIGNLSVNMTSYGQSLFGISGNRTLKHWNGPAMYSTGGWRPFATYTDNTSGYQGYAAIAGDYYGKGRVVLIGPHPELTSVTLSYLPLLIKWATNS